MCQVKRAKLREWTTPALAAMMWKVEKLSEKLSPAQHYWTPVFSSVLKVIFCDLCAQFLTGHEQQPTTIFTRFDDSQRKYLTFTWKKSILNWKFHFTFSCECCWLIVHLLVRVEQCRLHNNWIECRLCKLLTLSSSSRWSTTAEGSINHRMWIRQIIGSNAVKWIDQSIAR